MEKQLCATAAHIKSLRSEKTFPEPEEVPACTHLQQSLWWLPGAQMDSQDRLKQVQQSVQRQSLSRCGGAAKVTPRAVSVSGTELFPGKALCKAAWLRQFSAGNLHWFLSDLQNILDGSHIGLSLPDSESWLGKWPEHTCSDATHHWGRGKSLRHPEQPRACCQSHSKVVWAGICISVYLANVQNSKSLKSDLHMVEKSIPLPPPGPWWGRILWLSAGALRSATVAKSKGGSLRDTVALRLQFVCTGIAPQILDNNIRCCRQFSGNQEKQSTK